MRPLEPSIAGIAAQPDGHRRRGLGLGRLGAVAAAIWLIVMGIAGWELHAAQDRSRHQVAARVEARTEYAGSFISIYARDLLARERAAARSWFAGPQVERADVARAAAALGLSQARVLDRRGAPSAPTISLNGAGGRISLTFAVPYPTASGTRVFAGAYGIGDTVLPTVLDHLLSMPGWRAALVDRSGPRLEGGPFNSARNGEVSFGAAVAGTPWRIVARVPASQLYGFLDGPGRWLAWLALGGLTMTGLAVIVLIGRLARRRAELTALNAELARLAAVDALTGLRNRRAIEQYLHDALSAARRHGLSLSLLVLDVDHFKHFNDTLGHRIGDVVLAHTARVMNGALRAEDAIGRWGGEEFLVVLPGTDEAGALHATERLRTALAADQPDEARAHGLAVTVTIGAAQWGGEAMEELLSRADAALYLGKRAGRDTVEVDPVTREVDRPAGHDVDPGPVEIDSAPAPVDPGVVEAA